MHRIFETFMGLMTDENFLGFQNDLALDIYNELGKGFSANDNEVSLVTKLCDITKGKSYGPISIYSDKIHGGRSYVEFNYMDKPVTKELGDMAIITIVSSGRERLLQKMCLIQNKKGNNAESSKNVESFRWDIDSEQLYLLKNFPRLSGKKGILKHCRDISFRNTEGGLGAFGLMHFPGDMIFVVAPLLAELLKGRKSLNTFDISVVGSNYSLNRPNGMGFPAIPFSGKYPPEEIFFMYEKLWHRYGGMWPHMYGGNMACLGNTPFARDMYDFIRAWTQVNIGETSFAFGEVINTAVDGLSNALLKQIGFGEGLDLPISSNFAEFRWEGELGVAVTHVDVEREWKKNRK